MWIKKEWKHYPILLIIIYALKVVQMIILQTQPHWTYLIYILIFSGFLRVYFLNIILLALKNKNSLTFVIFINDTLELENSKLQPI